MKSQNQFVAEMKVVNSGIEILGQYTGTHKKILCKCKKCGCEWNARPHDLLDGHGCPNCAYVKRGFGRRKTNEEFIIEMAKKHPELEILSMYESNHKPINVKCLNCNNIWTTSPSSLLRGSGCPECAKGSMGQHRINKEEFIKRLNEVHPTIMYEKGYISFSDRADFKCSICGFRWTDIPQQLLIHKGCPQCVKKSVHDKVTKTQEDFCEELKSINPKIKVIGKYVTAQSMVEVKCLVCGCMWNAKPNLLLRGSGCPNCAHTSTSYIEQLIRLSFAECLGNEYVISRDRKTIGKELDIYIPSINLAIEYGAWVWHKNQLKRDIEKQKRCNDKGIRLIRIYDACGEDKRAVGENVYLFEESISKKQGHEKDFITWLFKICNQTFSINDLRFQELKETAYRLSRRKTTERLQEELKEKNPNIIITGEYQYDNVKISIMCNKCGYSWSATPSNLLQGWGCPRCSGKLKRTQEQFVKEMEKQHPTIRVVGEYIGSNKPVLCECNVCGYLWNSQPGWLLNQGHGCPKCSGRMRWTHQEFVDKMESINSNIIVLGKYKNSSTKITCKCKICGFIWDPIPHNIIRGSGCPECYRNRERKQTKKT